MRGYVFLPSDKQKSLSNDNFEENVIGNHHPRIAVAAAEAVPFRLTLRTLSHLPLTSRAAAAPLFMVAVPPSQ